VTGLRIAASALAAALAAFACGSAQKPEGEGAATTCKAVYNDRNCHWTCLRADERLPVGPENEYECRAETRLNEPTCEWVVDRCAASTCATGVSTCINR
jgi:hypothetical protein